MEIPQPNSLLLIPPPEFKTPDENVTSGEFIQIMVDNNKKANTIRDRYISLQEYVRLLLETYE